MQVNRHLTLLQMFNLNFGSLGIQFAWALEVANMSGIYAFFGAKESSLGYLWLALPITGLIIQPIIGHCSDNTKTRYGKRLPYIFFGALITAIAMFLLPNATSLVMTIILLWIFTAAINASLQPFRTLVADMAPPKQHTKVYAIQAAVIGIGATLASLSPWVLLYIFGKHPVVRLTIPFEIKLSFYIGGIILIISNLWTVLSTKKYLPHSIKDQSGTDKAESIKLKNICRMFVEMPKLMRRVSYVQFFTWMGIFCFIVYFTPVIEQNIFKLPSGLHAGLRSDFVLEKSVVLTGIACAVYMFVNIVYAYFIPFLSRKITRKRVHILSLLIGALSLLSIGLIHSRIYLLVAMIGVGIAWASLNSIPFAMVASVMPRKNRGLYMGIFNIAICLPQILVGLTIGYLLKTFLHGNTDYVMFLAGGFFILAAITTLFVQDKPVSV